MTRADWLQLVAAILLLAASVGLSWLLWATT
jgi:hypothetical protein